MGSRRMMAAAALILCVMAFYTSPAMRTRAVTTGAPVPLTNGDFLRFHVIANSDSAEDQALKFRVRDGLLEEIDRKLTLHTMASAGPGTGRVELTQDQVRAYVGEHLEEIAQTAEKIVRTLGYEYDVAARLEVCQIPEKTYGKVTFPEGQYEALNVTIGSGDGQNWWCVLYPPLCLVGAEPLPSKYDPLVQAAAEGAKTGQPVKLELRFLTLDFIDGLTEG